MTNRKMGILITVICVVISLLPVAAGLILFDRLPGQLPILYTFEGEVNMLADKIVCITLIPAICAVITLVLAILLRSFIKRSAGFYLAVLMTAPIFSCSMQAMTLSGAFGFEVTDMTITMILAGVLFYLLGAIIPAIGPNPLIGARFPWLADDDEAWYKTQVFTGRFMIVSGLICIIDAFADIGGMTGDIVLILGATVLLVISAGIYSYSVAKH